MSGSNSLQYNNLSRRLQTVEVVVRELVEMNSLLRLEVDLLKKRLENGTTTDEPATETSTEESATDLTNLRKALAKTQNQPGKSISISN